MSDDEHDNHSNDGGDAAEMIACEDCGTLVAEMSMTMHKAVRCRGGLGSAARPNHNNTATANDNHQHQVLVSSSNIHDHPNNEGNNDNNNDVIDLSSPPPPAAASRKRSDEDLSSPQQPRRRQRRVGEGRLKRDADYDDDDDDVEMMDGSDDDATNNNGNTHTQQNPEVVDLLDDCEEEDEWSCPACTLFNDKTASRCDACGAPNPIAPASSSATRAGAMMGSDGVRAADPVRRERLIGGDDDDFSYGHHQASFHYQRDSRRQQQQPSGSSANSPLSVMSGGAILGGIVGAAGNYMRGRPIGEGALRGATAGAMGGVVVNEFLRSPDYRSSVADNSSSPLSQARSAGANGLPAYPTMGDSSRSNNGNGATRRSSRQPRQSFRVSQQQSPDGLTTTTVVQSSGHGGSTRIVRRSQRGLEQARGDPMMAYMMHSMMTEGGLTGMRGGRAAMGRNNDVDNMSYDQLLQAFGDGTENLGASVNDISLLPTSRVHITEDGKIDLPPDACECSVCLERFEANDMRKTLPCLHGFHEGCIDKWLHTNGVCPVCKFPVDQRRQQQQQQY